MTNILSITDGLVCRVRQPLCQVALPVDGVPPRSSHLQFQGPLSSPRGAEEGPGAQMTLLGYPKETALWSILLNTLTEHSALGRKEELAWREGGRGSNSKRWRPFWPRTEKTERRTTEGRIDAIKDHGWDTPFALGRYGMLCGHDSRSVIT